MLTTLSHSYCVSHAASTALSAPPLHSIPVQAKAQELASLPPQALQLGKKIIRDKQRAALDAANEAECALIKTRWLSDECMSAVMSFLSKGK